jgi:hypothetical protein
VTKALGAVARLHLGSEKLLHDLLAAAGIADALR